MAGLINNVQRITPALDEWFCQYYQFWWSHWFRHSDLNWISTGFNACRNSVCNEFTGMYTYPCKFTYIV